MENYVFFFFFLVKTIHKIGIVPFKKFYLIYIIWNPEPAQDI